MSAPLFAPVVGSGSWNGHFQGEFGLDTQDGAARRHCPLTIVVKQLVEATIRVSDLEARRAAAHSFASQTPMLWSVMALPLVSTKLEFNRTANVRLQVWNCSLQPSYKAAVPMRLVDVVVDFALHVPHVTVRQRCR